MPHCQLSVTCDLSKQQIVGLSSQLHDALVEIADKPATSIMINIIPNCNMFLNKESDAAFFEVNAVGLSDDELKEKLGVRFLEIISNIAGINYDRIYVHFAISKPEVWVLRGHSLSYWKKQKASGGTG